MHFLEIGSVNLILCDSIYLSAFRPSCWRRLIKRKALKLMKLETPLWKLKRYLKQLKLRKAVTPVYEVDDIVPVLYSFSLIFKIWSMLKKFMKLVTFNLIYFSVTSIYFSKLDSIILFEKVLLCVLSRDQSFHPRDGGEEFPLSF